MDRPHKPTPDELADMFRPEDPQQAQEHISYARTATNSARTGTSATTGSNGSQERIREGGPIFGLPRS